jgi:Mlc titration factor MtfA (ptsG expression regulator)
VKGLTVSTGYIYFSWHDFLNGYKNDSDKINLALHELAHALYIDRFHGNYSYEWEVWKMRAEGILEEEQNNTEKKFFRSYGKSNLNEFWAVTVEVFFEDPINFKKEYPGLYAAIANVLDQDMALRKENALKTV